MKTVPLALAAIALSLGCGGAQESSGTSASAVTHTDGQGHSWTDANPLSTFTQDEAMAACAAFTAGASNTCATVTSCYGTSSQLVTTFGVNPGPPNSLWGWIYSGANAGGVVHVTSMALPSGQTQRASSLCVAPSAVAAGNEVPPPMTIVAQWQ